MADVFNKEPVEFVDLNELFPVLNSAVGLTYEQFRVLVENTFWLKNQEEIGVVKAFIVSGSSQFGSLWLSETDGGAPLIPNAKYIYIVQTNGNFKNKIFSWNGSVYEQLAKDSDNNYTNADKQKVDKLKIDGDGTKFLANDGLYKAVSGGGGIPEAPLDGEPYLRKGGDWVEGVSRKERISAANNYAEVEIKRNLNANSTPDTFEVIFDKGGPSQPPQQGVFFVNALGKAYFTTDKFYYPRNISFKDVEIATGDWSSDAEFSALDFNYSADIPISVDAYFAPNIDFSNYEPHIIFAPTESTGGNFAGFAKTLWKSTAPYYFVRIYAKEVPSATITLPLVKVMEV